MRRFGFVILNYQTEEETIACVKSIEENFITEDVKIIIVDNASKDNSGKRLKEKYRNKCYIKVILNASNEGYARGNNIGYRWAKYEFCCNYIVLLNSDTLIIQNDFCAIVEREYHRSKCAVIGPMILKNGLETKDNPGRKKPFNEKKLLIFIMMNCFFLMLNYLNIDQIPVEIFEKYAAKKKDDKNENKRIEDVALHGCCLIFTPCFVKHEEGLNPETYMYMEEDLLYEKMHFQKMNMVYQPELKIEHKGAGSTEKIYGTGRKKRQFIYRNMIRSSRVLWKYKRNLDKYKKE